MNHENISVSSFGAQVSAVKRLPVATILIHTLNGIKLPVSVLIVPELAAPVRNSIHTHLNHLPYLHHLPLAHPVTSDENFHISILIFIGILFRIEWSVVMDLQLLSLDLAICCQALYPSHSLSVHHVSKFQTYLVSLNIQITYNTFWKVESMGTTTPHHDQDTKFLQNYLSTKVSTQSDGFYCLKFPWKNNHPPFPSNYSICARRTRSMAFRLAKTPNLLRMYSSIIEDQERKGFIEKVDSNLEHTTSTVHYIPHHPVKKESSTTSCMTVAAGYHLILPA